MKYAEVIIDNKTDHTDRLYTYGCIYDEVKVGSKVRVPFGQGDKIRDAFVFQVNDNLQKEIKNLKYIESIDEEISLSQEMISTAEFMQRRYLCRAIDGVRCFLPAGSPSKRGKQRIPYKDEDLIQREKPLLTDEQKGVLEDILPKIHSEEHEIFLINGVTGSGKTEIYLRAVEETLAMGKTAIMLVPEISLAEQMVERFFECFGKEKIAVLHSKLSQGERYDEWKRIRSGNARIVIGARSAIFAPVENIGIVIMDEEHETSYKSDMTPKYDTVEIAIKRLKEWNGVLLLGSATPSVVSYSRAKEGIYRLEELKQRYNQVPLPEVSVVDMRQELLRGNKTILSNSLYHGIEKNLAEGKQIILFLNRRGYSTFVSCRECGYVMKCEECGISMTYHKEAEACVCHYCGRTAKIPKVCPECGSKYIRYFGTGTEKVEEVISEMFPEAKVARLDLDTIKHKGSIGKILKDFKKGKTDILVGTQIVAKGLDFKNVGLVGIISADVALNIPDFRSAERTFQLITQAAGRAGRGENRGSVIIQTYTPEHYAVKYAAKQDFEGFFEEEIMLRKLVSYPPYCDMIQLLFSAEDEEISRSAAEAAVEWFNATMPEDLFKNVYEVQKSPLSKENGKFRYQILMKAPKGSRGVYLKFVAVLKQQLIEDKNKKYNLTIDINPYSFM